MQQTSEVSNDEYFIHQFSTSCIAQFSYYIESKKEAIIIDPIRESDMYLELLQKRGASLKYILETHFHADFVSGHVELAKKTGATIVFGPQAIADYSIVSAKDDELLLLGSVSIKVIHTPGHTQESSCFLLLDSNKNPKALFTGDTVFLGDVGRPDLAVKSDLTERDLASMLFDSIQKLKTLPDDLIIYPGHGAGSACGKNISTGAFCTLGRQKVNNYALNQNLSKDEFIEIVTSNLPTPPQYFFLDVMLNKKGCQLVESILERSLKSISIDESFKLLTENKDEVVFIDNRDFNQAIQKFIKGSYLISLKMQYAIWTAQMLKPEMKIVIICDQGKETESIVRLARVGYENVLGFVDGGFEALAKDERFKNLVESVSVPDFTKIKEIISGLKTSNSKILDVREKGEWQSTGTLSAALTIPLGKLKEEMTKVREESKSKTIAVHCKTGGRAALAVSILKMNDVKEILFLGGTTNMIEQNVEFIPFNN